MFGVLDLLSHEGELLWQRVTIIGRLVSRYDDKRFWVTDVGDDWWNRHQSVLLDWPDLKERLQANPGVPSKVGSQLRYLFDCIVEGVLEPSLVKPFPLQLAQPLTLSLGLRQEGSRFPQLPDLVLRLPEMSVQPKTV